MEKKYSYINIIQCKYLLWVMCLSLQTNDVRRLICFCEWVMRQHNKLGYYRYLLLSQSKPVKKEHVLFEVKINLIL